MIRRAEENRTHREAEGEQPDERLLTFAGIRERLAMTLEIGRLMPIGASSFGNFRFQCLVF